MFIRLTDRFGILKFFRVYYFFQKYKLNEKSLLIVFYGCYKGSPLKENKDPDLNDEGRKGLRVLIDGSRRYNVT